jgi:hypothetical protein
VSAVRLGGLRRLIAPLKAAALIGLASALSGCASLATMNVRAEREYQNEDPNAAVIRDRLEDCEAVLALVDELLARTPYAQGGSQWVYSITLDDEKGAALKAQVAASPPYTKGEHEVPVVKLYRLHLEDVLRQAKAAPGEPTGPGAARHASILDAIATLAPGAASIKNQWRVFQRAQRARVEAELKGASLNDLAAADRSVEGTKVSLQRSFTYIQAADTSAVGKKPLALELLAVVSVALRAHLEGAALLPTVVVQSTHANQIAERDILLSNGQKPAIPLAGIPRRAEAIEHRAEVEVSVTQEMADSLTELTGVSLVDTAGWKLRPSIVDQVVGINLDSVRMRLRGDTELLFFHQLGVRDGKDSGYRGHTRRLAYDADPIGFVGARLIATFDWIHVKNAARLNAGFATDRLFSSGGTIKNYGSLGAELGLTGLASDVFDIGLDLIGVRTSVKIAKFTSGEVREVAVNPMSGADMATIAAAPLQLSYKQLDVGYDISFLIPETAAKYWIEDFLIGFRYMGYRLPRILYETEDIDPDPEVTRFAFSRESPAQALDTDYYMGGFSARFGQGDVRAVSLFGDIGLYGGSGPASYYFLRDPAGDSSMENRDARSTAVIAFNGSAGLGVRFRFTPRRMRLRALAELGYHADFIGQTIISEITQTRTEDSTIYTVGKRVDFGGIDVYHGPRLQLVGVF